MSHDPEYLEHLRIYGLTPDWKEQAEARRERKLREEIDFHNFMSMGGATLSSIERQLSNARDQLADSRPPDPEREGDGNNETQNFNEEDEIVATINVRGVDYNITGRDTMLFTAALVRGLNQETSTIKLASGDVLELTLADIEDISAQLVGPMS